jgi:predicted TIM-barrel fold metal-dependent hydrolase
MPSEYIKDHVRLTTQPIEEPEDPRDLLRIFEIVEAERTLLYSSDYPHWDFDNPHTAFPPGTPAHLRRRIMAENAIELYRLPSTRPDVAPTVATIAGSRADGSVAAAAAHAPDPGE